MDLSRGVQKTFSFSLGDGSHLSLSCANHFCSPSGMSEENTLARFISVQQMRARLRLSNTSGLRGTQVSCVNRGKFETKVSCAFCGGSSGRRLIGSFRGRRRRAVSALSSRRMRHISLCVGSDHGLGGR